MLPNDVTFLHRFSRHIFRNYLAYKIEYCAHTYNIIICMSLLLELHNNILLSYVHQLHIFVNNQLRLWWVVRVQSHTTTMFKKVLLDPIFMILKCDYFRSLCIVFLETSRRFDLSSRNLGHVMFFFRGNVVKLQDSMDIRRKLTLPCPGHRRLILYRGSL